jgi:hypothetical protein
MGCTRSGVPGVPGQWPVVSARPDWSRNVRTPFASARGRRQARRLRRRRRTHRSPTNATSGACSSGGPAFRDTPLGSIQASESPPAAQKPCLLSFLATANWTTRSLRHVLCRSLPKSPAGVFRTDFERNFSHGWEEFLRWPWCESASRRGACHTPVAGIALLWSFSRTIENADTPLLGATAKWRCDPRLAEAIDIVHLRRGEDGRWPLQYSNKGKTYFELERIGAPSHWNTLRAQRVLKWWTRG